MAQGPHKPGSLPPLKNLLAFVLRHLLLSSHRRTYPFQTIYPGSGWTMRRIMVFAATVRDIPHFFHAGIFLLSPPNSW